MTMAVLMTRQMPSRLPKDRAADHQVTAAAAAEGRHRVLVQADQRLEIPGYAGPEKEFGVGRPVRMQGVLQQVLQRDLGQDHVLRQRRRQHADENDDPGVDQSPALDHSRFSGLHDGHPLSGFPGCCVCCSAS
jgi:hypothetical protein